VAYTSQHQLQLPAYREELSDSQGQVYFVPNPYFLDNPATMVVCNLVILRGIMIPQNVVVSESYLSNQNQYLYASFS